MNDFYKHHQGDLGDVFEQFFGGGMFDELFGGGHHRRNPNAPIEGSDLRFDIEIDLEDAIFGTDKTIKIPRLETCSACKGICACTGAWGGLSGGVIATWGLAA